MRRLASIFLLPLLLVATVDCTNTRTAGVSVGLSPEGGATEFYVINGALVSRLGVPSIVATLADNAPNSANITGRIFISFASGLFVFFVAVPLPCDQQGRAGNVPTLPRMWALSLKGVTVSERSRSQ